MTPLVYLLCLHCSTWLFEHKLFLTNVPCVPLWSNGSFGVSFQEIFMTFSLNSEVTSSLLLTTFRSFESCAWCCLLALDLISICFKCQNYLGVVESEDRLEPATSSALSYGHHLHLPHNFLEDWTWLFYQASSRSFVRCNSVHPCTGQ